MISPLTIADLPELSDLLATEAGPDMRYPDAVDRVWVATFWMRAIESGASMSLLARNGGNEITGWILAMKAPDLYSGKPMALQQFWYVRKNGGSMTAMRLLDEFVELAKRSGCVRILVGDWSPRGDRDLSAIYERYGFEPMERYFKKELLCQ